MEKKSDSNYYSSIDASIEKSIFHLWERGGYHKDSITPATHVPEYRRHIASRIRQETPIGGKIFSLGCGNGFVEAELIKDGYTVSAIDLHSDAVALSRRRGVQTEQKDFFETDKHDFESVNCIYADGFIGHLYDHGHRLSLFFHHIETMLNGRSVNCVLSNDAPTNSKLEVQQHEAVPEFWYISAEHLASEVHSRGHQARISEYFSYDRPLSGRRRRTIVTFRIRGRNIAE